MLKQAKKEIVQQLKAVLDLPEEEIEKALEIPPKSDMGDFAFPCFRIAHSQGKDAKALSAAIASSLKPKGFLAKVEVKGPYVNFYLNDAQVVEHTLQEARSKGADYGKNDIGQGKMVVVDYSAPNWGKPMHVGHIRSTILGDTLINALKFSGYQTHGINYFGDIGLHIGKLIAAYHMWGDPAKIEADPEKSMLDLYVRFSKLEKEQKELIEAQAKDNGKSTQNKEMGPMDEEEEGLEKDKPVAAATKKAQEFLEKLESGDPELVKLWQQIGAWSQRAFDNVYALLDVKFDELTGQSHFTDRGKTQVKKALQLGVAYETGTGAIEAELKEYGLPNKIILKRDGTALYSTQDLGAATFRHEKFNFDKLIYVVAYEQNDYFKQVFKILDSMGYDWAKDCYHFSFGLISLEEGKMSTREGNVVFLEEVLSKAINLARQEIEKKNSDLPNKDDVAKAIGIGAIKYMVLSVDPIKDIAFSWERALNFESSSAPYIQYAYARANSLLRKAGSFPKTLDHYVLTSKTEVDLVKKIAQFPLVLENIIRPPYKLNELANYANALATSFNQFYKDVPVLTEQDEQAKYSRLVLVDSFKTTLENTLGIMGLKAPAQM